MFPICNRPTRVVYLLTILQIETLRCLLHRSAIGASQVNSYIREFFKKAFEDKGDVAVLSSTALGEEEIIS